MRKNYNHQLFLKQNPEYRDYYYVAGRNKTGYNCNVNNNHNSGDLIVLKMRDLYNIRCSRHWFEVKFDNCYCLTHESLSTQKIKINNKTYKISKDIIETILLISWKKGWSENIIKLIASNLLYTKFIILTNPYSQWYEIQNSLYYINKTEIILMLLIFKCLNIKLPKCLQLYIAGFLHRDF